MNMKPVKDWVFAFDQRSASWFGKMIMAAVASSKALTSLNPICLYDGDETPPVLEWLLKQGVKVHRTRVPFRDELFSDRILEANRGTPYHPAHASGSFLRLIASDFVDDDYYLYTDCDIMFLGDPEQLFCNPELIAAAPEVVENGKVSANDIGFNAGVMVVNRKAFSHMYDVFVDTLRENNFYFKAHTSYDQTMLNLVLRGKWSRLPPQLNWRPFQGPNKEAAILHFHGPKPHRISEILQGRALDYEHRDIVPLVLTHRHHYEHFLIKLNSFLSAS
jgi:lipopolysaccharide biosynthesis glycosyltransferase